MRARILLIVFLLLVVLSVSVIVGLEVFRVRDVVVLGCETRDPGEVVNLSGIGFEESIFKIRFGEVRSRINQNPYYDVLSISYLFPDRIKIEVHERGERAVIQFSGALVVMDEEGYIVEVRNTLEDLRVPVITGMNVTSYQVGEVVVSQNPGQVDAMHIILTELMEQNVTQLVSEINVEVLSDLHLITANGFRVNLGNFEKMEEKIKWMRATVPVLVSEGYLGGTINVSTGENATFQAEESAQPVPAQEPQAEEEPQEQEPEDTPEPTPTPTDEQQGED